MNGGRESCWRDAWKTRLSGKVMLMQTHPPGMQAARSLAETGHITRETDALLFGKELEGRVLSWACFFSMAFRPE